MLSRLVGIARSSPLGHTSILNALDLHLRGLSILVTGNDAEALHEAALPFPISTAASAGCGADESLDDNHPAKALAASGAEAQALVCAGMRCSLPVTDEDGLRARVTEMLSSHASRIPD